MISIDIKDIAEDPRNVRSAPAEIDALIGTIKAPMADITVNEIPDGDRGPGYEVLGGHTRLKAQLELHGKALVRVTGTSAQFHVRLDARGHLVRV